MGHFIKSFIRVHRQLDDADRLLDTFARLEASALTTDPSSVSDDDKRRILDFPERETQTANIAAVTSLTKAALTATGSTEAHREKSARSKAGATLLAVSQQYLDDVTSRLANVRTHLYEANEEAVIRHAEDQALKRTITLAIGPQDEDADEPQRRWGYAVFIEPGHEPLEDYLSRRDVALFHTRCAVCCGDQMDARWKLQRQDWPAEAAGDDGADDNLPLGTAAKADALRERFRSIRDCAPKRQRVGQGAAGTQGSGRGGLAQGILDNVFLVVDGASIESVVSQPRIVDGMWVWAVDPDFKSVDGTPSSSPLPSSSQAKGKEAPPDETRERARITPNS
ncbi:hypothetical protein F4808DRAFT_456232 [Astrocystis sublimbata]|nr:hypothetical protein F4808DRAFT_456232 [Astrocystis sublimbata]